MEDFRVVGEITGTETIAESRSLRDLRKLEKLYGSGQWRKRKGVATVEVTETGRLRLAEIHWYEAHGVGRKGLKIKKFLD